MQWHLDEVAVGRCRAAAAHCPVRLDGKAPAGGARDEPVGRRDEYVAA